MSTFDGFKATKDALSTALNRLTALFERRGQRDLFSRAWDLADKLAAERFNLVVLGQFKRGKSTLINALLGAELLPTAVVPLTSIVTILHHGPQPRAIVSFLVGRQLEVAVTNIACRLWALERAAQIEDLRRQGITVVEWYPEDPLEVVLAAATQRRRMWRVAR
jgi:Dynamin family